MQANKTQAGDEPVGEFIDGIPNARRQRDSRELARLMHAITHEKAVIWGTSIVGFGSQHYRYESGREGDTATVGFAPRKDALVVYGVLGDELNWELAEKLGPHTTGKGCLYIRDLSQIDTSVLGEMIDHAFRVNSSS